MDIVISNAAGKPIYEQIASQVKLQVMKGTLRPGEQLPSIRSLANDLGVSVITTKRAYSDLEDQGFIQTVQGKGSFVASGNEEFLQEERLKRIEDHLAKAADEAQLAGISPDQLHEMLDAVNE